MKPGVQMPHCSAAFFEERLLQRVQLAVRGDAFDRRHRLALDLGAEHAARVDEPAVENDAAGAAVAVVAAFLGAGQAETSRSASSRLWRGSQRNSVSSPLIVAVTCVRVGMVLCLPDRS